MYRVKVKQNIGIQAGPATMGRQNIATQCELLQNSNEKGSYQREVSTSGKYLTYDELVQNFLQSNTATIEWLKHIGLLASEALCPTCRVPRASLHIHFYLYYFDFINCFDHDDYIQ